MKKTSPKIGVFLVLPEDRFKETVDLKTLTEKIGKLKQVERCETIPDLWSETSLQRVREAVAAEEMDRALWIGRFTARQKQKLKGFLAEAGMNPYLNEWCDPEEQGIAPNRTPKPILTAKVLTLVKMALARVRLLKPLEPLEIPASDAVMVVGAGISGLHAAASLLERGKQVHLVEQRSGVGGKVALLSRFYPLLCDPHCGLEFVLKSLKTSERLTLHTLARPVSIEGEAGNFRVRLQTEPRHVDSDRCNGCGACMAVCPVDLPVYTDGLQDEPPFQREKGLGSYIKQTRKAIHPSVPFPFPETYVIERNACPPECRACEGECPTGAIRLDQTPAEETVTAGAVLAATGWDPYPLTKLDEYGYGKYTNVIGNLEMELLLSHLTGAAALKPAPDATGTDLPNVRLDTVGFVQCAGSRDSRHLEYCSSVCCSATLKQITQLKNIRPDTRCYVFYQDIRCPGFEEKLYRQVRRSGNVIFVRGFPKISGPNGNGEKITVTAEDTFSGAPVNAELDLLVLAGGMQPSRAGAEFAETVGLPRNEYGFLAGHYQCFPEESRRTGILGGGCARSPMNVSQSIESTQRAAMKALNYLEGAVAIIPEYPVVDKTKCDQCKRCVEECPYASYRYDEKEFPEPDLTKCRQCGNCMGVCPVAAISLNHLTIKQLSAQIEVLETSFLEEDAPLILAFLCENDAHVAARSAADTGLAVPPNVIHIQVPCAGAVNNALVADALSIGVDGVLIAGCREGQCHYISGNELVRKRSGDLKDKLESMMIESERVRFESIEIQDAPRYVAILNDYIRDLKEMGPNPFKI